MAKINSPSGTTLYVTPSDRQPGPSASGRAVFCHDSFPKLSACCPVAFPDAPSFKDLTNAPEYGLLKMKEDNFFIVDSIYPAVRGGPEQCRCSISRRVNATGGFCGLYERLEQQADPS